MAAKTTTKDPLDVGSSWAFSAIIGLVLLIAVVVGGLLAWSHFRSQKAHRIKIATGSPGGTYHALGRGLCAMLEKQKVVKRAEPLETSGSRQNMQLLSAGKVDLAFVQSDQALGDSVGLVTPLYEEVLHLLITKDSKVEHIEELEGLKVAIGAEGSGTREVVENILDHLDIRISDPLGLSMADVDAGFRKGSLDAAFLLTALPTPIVDRLCDEGFVRFLSLGDPARQGGLADAISAVLPSYRKDVIPIASYGSQPATRPIGTISVSALLVAAADTNVELVRQVTRALFDHRVQLGAAGGSMEIAKHIREIYTPGDWMIPYHDGAAQYYQRDEPPFLVQYAEALSLLLTLMVGSFSASLAFRGWLRRKRKNRIDAYYNELRRHSGDILAASDDDLRTYRDLLAGIRQRAFSDLVNEKLDANESFSIFQDYLRSELMAIESRLNKTG